MSSPVTVYTMQSTPLSCGCATWCYHGPVHNDNHCCKFSAALRLKFEGVSINIGSIYLKF
jgi:hypothetical protein